MMISVKLKTKPRKVLAGYSFKQVTGESCIDKVCLESGLRKVTEPVFEGEVCQRAS